MLFRSIATNIAESAGAKAEVNIEILYPITFNDLELTKKMLPTLQSTAGLDKVVMISAITGAEDFSFFQQKIPGFFYFLGGMPKGKKRSEAAPHHTPDFFIDESGLTLGVKSLCNLVVDYNESVVAKKK